MSPCLAGLVDWIYVYRCGDDHGEGLGGSVLPQLCWPVEGSFSWKLESGELWPVKTATVVFPCSSAVSIESRGPTTMVGLGLFPEGWNWLMPLPAAELADVGEDLSCFWGFEAARPLDVDPAASDREIAQALDARLVRRLASGPVGRPDPRAAVIAAWANGARQDIDALVAGLDVSHRQVDRIAQAAFGVGPRRLANKQRILRIAAGMSIGAYGDLRDAWTEGYADQPHFIRSFRAFIGTTPSRFRSDPALFVRDVMQARVKIASRHPLGLFVR